MTLEKLKGFREFSSENNLCFAQHTENTPTGCHSHIEPSSKRTTPAAASKSNLQLFNKLSSAKCLHKIIKIIIHLIWFTHIAESASAVLAYPHSHAQHSTQQKWLTKMSEKMLNIFPFKWWKHSKWQNDIKFYLCWFDIVFYPALCDAAQIFGLDPHVQCSQYPHDDGEFSFRNCASVLAMTYTYRHTRTHTPTHLFSK